MKNGLWVLLSKRKNPTVNPLSGRGKSVGFSLPRVWKNTEHSCVMCSGAGICNHIRFLTRQPSKTVSGQFHITQIFRASEYQIHGFFMTQIAGDRPF